jgi:transcriptional regulator with XRE-family HTH domain
VVSHIRCVINVRNEVVIKAFGIRVRKLRKERGYTMEKLAELAGIDYRQVSYIELGQVNITISSIYALAKALDLNMSELVNLEHL